MRVKIRKAFTAWLASGLWAHVAWGAPALPPDHVLVRDGGHQWRVWTPAMEAVLRRIDDARDAAHASP